MPSPLSLPGEKVQDAGADKKEIKEEAKGEIKEEEAKVDEVYEEEFDKADQS